MNKIPYTLVVKNVKNINLRVNSNGEVVVSANKHIPISKIDDFVDSKELWIEKAKKRIQNKPPAVSSFSDEECLILFNKISDQMFVIFEKYLKEKPLIKVRQMTSCWGVCHYKKGYITLNKSLMSKPLPAIEYVILHEYTHFLEPNHQDGFYKIISKIMPNYKERIAMLRCNNYSPINIVT